VNFDELNLSTVQAAGSIQPIPAGEYLGTIVEANDETGETRDGVPTRTVVVRVDITEGEQKGRRIYDRLLVVHPTEIAQQIGRSRLKSLIEAAAPGAKTSQELIGKTVRALVKVSLRKDTGENQNEVKSYKAAGPRPTASPTPPPPSAPAAVQPNNQAAADPNARPW
jgi:hypothetical protein